MRWLIGPLMVALTFCSTASSVHFRVHSEQAARISIPDSAFDNGDPTVGRHEFVNASCFYCHRVADDPVSFGNVTRAAAGPVLRDMNRYPANQLASRIVSSNASIRESRPMPIGTDGRTTWLDGTDRAMKSWTQPISTQQLVDIVAYLRNPAAAKH